MNGCDPAWLDEMRSHLLACMAALGLLIAFLNLPEKRAEDDE